MVEESHEKHIAGVWLLLRAVLSLLLQQPQRQQEVVGEEQRTCNMKMPV